MDSSPLSPGIIAWCGFCAIIIGAIVSALRPDNTFLPFSLPTKTRAALALVLGAVAACLTNITHGTPWMQAIVAAVVSVVTGFAASGAPRAAGTVVLLFALATGSAGCSALKAWWNGGGEQEVLTDAQKIAVDALKGMSLSEIAIDLGLDLLTIMQEVLKNEHLLGTAAQHEAVALQAGMAGVGCK